MKEKEIRKHNSPISKVIQGYMDKKGGKVKVSRNEIERRFDALDWRYQKQILFAFLQSCKSDRQWAYGKLYIDWDDCFIPVLKDLWEIYHEKKLSWLIIRYFPIDYLKSNLDSLSEGRNYYFLYHRLSHDSDFVLDYTRLNEADLLNVMLTSGEVVTDNDVRDIFFLLIYKLCKGAYEFKACRTLANHEDPPLLTLLNNSMITNIFIVINGGLEKYELATELRNWMTSVTQGFIRDSGPVYDFLYYKDVEFSRKAMKIYCLENIAQEYRDVWDSFDITDQQKFLDYLKERHLGHLSKYQQRELSKQKQLEYIRNDPALDKMLDIFGLEIVDQEKEDLSLPF